MIEPAAAALHAVRPTWPQACWRLGRAGRIDGGIFRIALLVIIPAPLAAIAVHVEQSPVVGKSPGHRHRPRMIEHSITCRPLLIIAKRPESLRPSTASVLPL